MKFYSKFFISVIGCVIFMFAGSCKKQDDWLNAKRLIGDVTPQTLADFQAILDNTDQLNENFTTIGSLEADNLYLDNTTFNAAAENERDAYTWSSNVWNLENGVSTREWNPMFTVIEYANIVLDGLKQIDPKTTGYNNVMGEALFFRAIAYYNLSQVFCNTYDVNTASTDLGLPIRLSSDVNTIYQRSSVQQTYDQIISDTKMASNLLDVTPLYIERPSRYAAIALLAKTYLVMQDYTNAGLYANQVLTYSSALFDFNSPLITLSNTYRFPANGLQNPEIIFFAESQYYNEILPNTGNSGYVDPALYASYDNNDLRKKYFYAASGANEKFRGAYTGSYYDFDGIGINEILLIRAECFARSGSTTLAMTDLNNLLVKRYLTGTFTPIVAATADNALQVILQERRKELPFTSDVRWEDLRRLNKEARFQVTITRILNGNTYTLSPNSTSYILPIPQKEIQLTGIQQNPR